MFGFSTRETLVRAIENACRNKIDVYKDCVREGLVNGSELSEEEILQHATTARIEYVNAVFNVMLESFQVSSPTIHARMKLVMWDPRITGIPDEFNIDYLADNGFPAGVTYAICYFAVTNKKILPSKDFQIMSRLNHYQSELMNDALVELDGN